MVELMRRKDNAFHHTKVFIHRSEILGDDLWMAERVLAILVAPRVQAAKVHILDLLVGLGFVEEASRVGTPSKEGLSRFQGLRDLEVLEECLHLWDDGHLSIDVAGPNLDHVVPIVSKELDLFQSSLVKFVHGEMVDWVDSISSITFWTSVPQTALDFPNRICLCVVSIDEIISNALFAMISGVADDDVVTLSDVGQHLEGNDRLIVFRCIATRWNDGDRVLAKKYLTVHQITSRGDGETLGERIHIGDAMEEFAKLKAAATKNVYIGLAVAQDLAFEVEDVVFTDKVIVPRVEFLAITGAHAFGVVVHGVEKRSHVVLVLGTVEEMWEKAFLHFCDAESLGEVCQTHRDETQRIDEFNV